MVLTANTMLTDTAGGTIRFASSIDGAHTLSVQTDGTTEFDGPVGGTTPLVGLLVQGYSASNAGTTYINGGSMTTASRPSYANSVRSPPTQRLTC